MRYLITGASGSLGYELTKNISKDQKILAHYHNNKLSLSNKNIETITTKKLIQNNYEKILEFKPDIIIHLAATGLKKKYILNSQIKKTNYDFTKNLIKVSAKLNLKMFIFASTSNIYELSNKPLSENSPLKNVKEMNEYEKSKYLSEQFFRHKEFKKIKFVILRLFPFIDKRDHRKNIFGKINEKIINKKKFLIQNPNYYISFVTSKFVSNFIIKLINILIKKRRKIFVINLGCINRPIEFKFLLEKIFAKNKFIFYNNNYNKFCFYPDNTYLKKIMTNIPNFKNRFISEINNYLINQNNINEKNY